MANYGCPLGSLCSEIDKRVDAPDFAVADLMLIIIGWAEDQFRQMGHGGQARDLALELLAPTRETPCWPTRCATRRSFLGRHVD